MLQVQFLRRALAREPRDEGSAQHVQVVQVAFVLVENVVRDLLTCKAHHVVVLAALGQMNLCPPVLFVFIGVLGCWLFLIQ